MQKCIKVTNARKAHDKFDNPNSYEILQELLNWMIQVEFLNVKVIYYIMHIAILNKKLLKAIMFIVENLLTACLKL